ncbi:biotin--[acetyl-CoA-carboxylase] ligase [Spirochaeta isovalerica]|uniref:biotin--[biotin carboxyl-carrier protein] ligase n=1 Tax=Spirochaeta isovalerica TaxID=150 RepID=A0A841REN9_9SPIO|nr:biotin--[acetyl-CoA-carboxylase] ligase [Spirochaeta isovalerica]MBB6482545.1 BirA family biotin operon repressor/biotin-[acetyl-CoA-carboxylase] ligase [Spirochaeta isovalerica]
MLRNSREPLSGERISRELGVSRVAVWKQIQNLIELGYGIESSSAGYALKDEADHLYPWEFPQEKQNYNAFKELDSTMTEARKIALKGCSDFTTVVAEKQNKGRGRGTKSWDSREGGLYFTWIIKPELPLAYHYIYTIGAVAALSRTVNDLYGVDARAKWPNDLVAPEGKVAGVLSEMECSGEKISWLNLGIGINVNNKLDSEDRTSLKELSGHSIDRKELLNSFEEQFRRMLSRETPGSIRAMWENRNSTIGQAVRLRSEQEGLLTGRAVGLTKSGSLIVRKGKIETTALFGDIYEK